MNIQHRTLNIQHRILEQLGCGWGVFLTQKSAKGGKESSGGGFEQRSELASNRPELATAMTNGNGNVTKGTKMWSSWVELGEFLTADGHRWAQTLCSGGERVA